MSKIGNEVITAVIPAAGKGTRLLPYTKTMPKELMPVVNPNPVPIIEHNVVECANSGISKLVLISGKEKVEIRNHFDLCPELEAKLKTDGKHELAQRLHAQTDLVPHICEVRQHEQKGLGHAVLCAKEFVGEKPFAVLLGDDMVKADNPCTKQLIDVYNKYGKSVVALMQVPDEQVSKFGICEGVPVEGDGRCIDIKTMIEKPDPSEVKSRMAIVGRYVLSPTIFEILERTKPGKGGEIQLTDALAELALTEGVIGLEFDGERFDAGSVNGWLKANLCYAMDDLSLAQELTEYFQELKERPSKS